MLTSADKADYWESWSELPSPVPYRGQADGASWLNGHARVDRAELREPLLPHHTPSPDLQDPFF